MIMMMKSQRSIFEPCLKLVPENVRVGTVTMQREVSSALPPPLCGIPNTVGGEGLKEKPDVRGTFRERCSTSHVHRWVPVSQLASCRPGGQGESGDFALQQQTLEEAFFGA